MKKTGTYYEYTIECDCGADIQAIMLVDPSHWDIEIKAKCAECKELEEIQDEKRIDAPTA